MSPRGKEAGAWAKTGEVLINAEGDPSFRFRNVTAGGERLEVHITHVAISELGALTIQGIWIDKPINARRLKALPLDAIRSQCERLIQQKVRLIGLQLAKHIINEVVGAETPNLDAELAIASTPANDLRTLTNGDTHSDEFLSAIAKVSRESRKNGKSAWRAVKDATGVEQAQAQRYLARADARAKQAATKREAAKFNTGKLRRTTDKTTPIRLQNPR